MRPEFCAEQSGILPVSTRSARAAASPGREWLVGVLGVEESTWHVAGELWGQAYVRDLRGGGSGELASVEGAACGGAASGVTIPRRENDLNNRPNSPALGGLPSAMFSLLKLSYCCTNSAYESCTSSPSVLHFSMSSTLNASSFPVAETDFGN